MMKERMNIRRFFRQLWTSFPAAALLCAALAGLMIGMDWLYDGSTMQLAEKALQACICGLCLSVLGSLMSRRYGWPRWLCWMYAGVGIGFSLLLKTEYSMTYWGVCAAAVALCFYYANGRDKRAKRLAQIGGCFFSSFGLSFCLFMALMLCFYAVSALFFADNYRISDHLINLAFVLSFLLAAPWLFLGRLPGEEEDTESRGGFRRVTANLFLPFYLVLVGILLGYILMILIRWQMPVGQMNGLALTAMSLYTVFHLTLTGEENRISRWFIRWGAWLMLPVIAVQQVGVWMRFDAYGLTPARYAGMLVTLLLVLAVGWGLVRKRANWFFAGAAALALMLFVSPVNVNQTARWNQEARLRGALNACGMLDASGKILPNAQADAEQQRIIISAADYLRWLDDVPEGSFTHAFQQQMVSDSGRMSNLELFGFQQESEYSWETLTAQGTDSSTAVNVSGFRYAEWYSSTVDFDDEAEMNGLIVPAQQLMAAADWEQEKLLQEEFPLADGRVLRLTRLVLSKENEQPHSMRVQGWLLTPEE